ncbi:MAG: NAD(P)/FAD-dependent oxidoreductase [Bacilli bacterium]|jgi:sarcosine oxidase subunit beta
MKPKKTDVLIVGAGIIGCSTAYYLSKRGLSVTVLEGSDYIGNGGSSRNGGGVRQSGRDPRELPMAIWGIKNLWPGLSEELDSNVEYVQEGNLRLGKTEKHRQILTGLTGRAVDCGLDVVMIDGDKVREINPHLSDEVTCASWCATDGHANPMATTLAFYRAARKNGVHFYTGVPVTELRKIKGRVAQAITPDGVFEADSILLAAGYASREIAETVGIDIPMSHRKGECLVTEAQPKMFDQMLGTADADFYGHQTEHGSFVFGGSTGFEECQEPDEQSFSTSRGASATCRGIMKYFPELSDSKIVRAWAGWMDICVDKIPVISEVEEVPGLYLACGFSGHGFGIGPAVGYNLAELIAGEEPEVNLREFRYDRFRPSV